MIAIRWVFYTGKATMISRKTWLCSRSVYLHKCVPAVRLQQAVGLVHGCSNMPGAEQQQSSNLEANGYCAGSIRTTQHSTKILHLACNHTSRFSVMFQKYSKPRKSATLYHVLQHRYSSGDTHRLQYAAETSSPRTCRVQSPHGSAGWSTRD